MKVKTDELQGPALDWAVAQAQQQKGWIAASETGKKFFIQTYDGPKPYSPCTDWAQAGPIIDRSKVSLLSRSIDGKDDWWACDEPYDGDNEDERMGQDAGDPLTAAMRCVVASKFGAEVEVPDELCAQSVCFYDIEWDDDDGDANMPSSLTLPVSPDDIGDLNERGADIISDATGWCVKSFNHRIATPNDIASNAEETGSDTPAPGM